MRISAVNAALLSHSGSTRTVTLFNSMLLQELQNLLPDLSGSLHNLNPQILKALTADTSLIALRLLQLTIWFPSANISIMVARRSDMLQQAYHVRMFQ